MGSAMEMLSSAAVLTLSKLLFLTLLNFVHGSGRRHRGHGCRCHSRRHRLKYGRWRSGRSTWCWTIRVRWSDNVVNVGIVVHLSVCRSRNFSFGHRFNNIHQNASFGTVTLSLNHRNIPFRFKDKNTNLFPKFYLDG